MKIVTTYLCNNHVCNFLFGEKSFAKVNDNVCYDLEWLKHWGPLVQSKKYGGIFLFR